MDKNATSITPSYPPQKISEEVSHMGQFSMQINFLSGSFLRAIQHYKDCLKHSAATPKLCNKGPSEWGGMKVYPPLGEE